MLGSVALLEGLLDLGEAVLRHHGCVELGLNLEFILHICQLAMLLELRVDFALLRIPRSSLRTIGLGL